MVQRGARSTEHRPGVGRICWWVVLPILQAFVALLAIGIVLAAGVPKPKSQVGLEQIAAWDPRIEYVARAICVARGINPDYRGFPYPPGPVWETFILQARDFLAADDAADRWAHRKP